VVSLRSTTGYFAGKPPACYKLMRPLLFALILGFAFESPLYAQQNPYHQASANLTHADIDFFFHSITFKNGECQFELTANTVGMLWRIKTDKTDLTGACLNDQILAVPDTASLKIKRKELNLYFLPLGPGVFNVRFIIKPEPGVSHDAESREATFLQVRNDGTYSIAISED
jgi:hypothetical protein